MRGRLTIWTIAALCTAVCGLALVSLASAAELPDGRGYEQVSTENKLGTEVYQPYDERIARSNTDTELTFQAAANGSSLAFVEGPTVGGSEIVGEDGGNEYLARRSVDGIWSQSLLTPENAPSSIFEAFSPDLDTAFVSSLQPLSPNVPGYGENTPSEEGWYSTTTYSYDRLYTVSTAGGEYIPSFSTNPPYRPVAHFGTVDGTAEMPGTTGRGCRVSTNSCMVLEGVSADDTHLLFAANDALTGASEGRPAAEGGTSSAFVEENNLYESVNGRLRLVNVLPDGTTHANAAFGGVEKYGNNKLRPIFSRVISADGSRIFWTDLGTGHLYVREDGARTVEISATGIYQTATSDGSTVFYTNGDLYAYEVESGQTTDLTPGVAVNRVVGTSENDDFIYYLNGENKLAVLHDGVSKPITTAPIVNEAGAQVAAEVTPDGHSIVFDQRVTVNNGFVARVEVYDADTETLHCASCASLGTEGYLQESNSENVYQPRWISTDGSRVFFVSLEGLVPQDVNEEQDVYEWERPGTGGCTESGGCVYLLTGGTSIGQSSFLDASENGSDVFVVTRANLVGSDEDGAFDAYDVRLGAQQQPTPPQCTGTGCQGISSAPPIFATPSSVTFEGVGNFAPAAKETEAKPKPKKKAKHKKKLKHRKSKAKKSARKADSRRRSSSRGGRS